MTSIGTMDGSPFGARVDAGRSCHCQPMLRKLSQSTCALAVHGVFAVMCFSDIELLFAVSGIPSQSPQSSGGHGSVLASIRRAKAPISSATHGRPICFGKV